MLFILNNLTKIFLVKKNFFSFTSMLNITNFETTIKNFCSTTPTTSANIMTKNSLRNFLCVGCNLSFCTHRVLRKHLQSKNHVKTLITLGQISEDAQILIKDYSHLLASIDATTCKTAKYSIISNILVVLFFVTNFFQKHFKQVTNR